jgi:hypothetical protein
MPGIFEKNEQQITAYGFVSLQMTKNWALYLCTSFMPRST